MGRPTRVNAGAYGTHNVDINTKIEDQMGQKPMLDFYTNTVSKNSPVRNDLHNDIGGSNETPVKRDVNNNSSIGPNRSIGNLFIKHGSGRKVNFPISK